MTNESEQWKACHGELGTLVGTLSRSRRQQTVLRRTGFCVIAIFCIVGGGLMLGKTEAKPLAPMNCREVKKHTHEFLADALDSQSEQRFRDHLDKCRGCAGYVERMRIELARIESATADAFFLVAGLSK